MQQEVSGVRVVMLWYLSNRTVYWIQDGYLAATGLGPFDEETLEFPSASSIGQIPAGLVLAGMLFAAVTAFRSGVRRGWCTVAAAVVLLAEGGVAVAAVTEQAGQQARDCARGWQRTAVETGTSWSIRCIDENFRLQGNVGHAREHQRYELGRDSRIYTLAR